MICHKANLKALFFNGFFKTVTHYTAHVKHTTFMEL